MMSDMCKIFNDIEFRKRVSQVVISNPIICCVNYVPSTTIKKNITLHQKKI